jgi:D-arabinose 1-dehydrogenase-like Zn-dependent alcohol dehydrogenase
VGVKAIVLREYGDADRLKWDDVAPLEPGGDEVVIRNHTVGLNHCDIDLRRGLFGVASAFPHVMGVDCAGTVAKVGPGVSGVAIGERVMPHFVLACGTCHNCQRGHENICLRADLLGITTWGGYAQFTRVRQNHLVRLPDALSFEDAVAGTILSSPAISAPSTRQGGERWGRPQIALEPAIGGWALYPVRDLVLQCTV